MREPRTRTGVHKHKRLCGLKLIRCFHYCTGNYLVFVGSSVIRRFLVSSRIFGRVKPSSACCPWGNCEGSEPVPNGITAFGDNIVRTSEGERRSMYVKEKLSLVLSIGWNSKKRWWCCPLETVLHFFSFCWCQRYYYCLFSNFNWIKTISSLWHLLGCNLEEIVEVWLYVTFGSTIGVLNRVVVSRCHAGMC